MSEELIEKLNLLGSFLITHGVIGYPTYTIAQMNAVYLYFILGLYPNILLIVILLLVGSIIVGILAHAGSTMLWKKERYIFWKILFITGLLILLSTSLMAGVSSLWFSIIRRTAAFFIFYISLPVSYVVSGFFSHRIYDLVYRKYSPFWVEDD